LSSLRISVWPDLGRDRPIPKSSLLDMLKA
jgi:hypothetical protein